MLESTIATDLAKPEGVTGASGRGRLLNLERANFRYEPFPIGIIRDIFEPSFYGRLVKTFPPVELFRFMQDHGDKWSLSQFNHPDQYYKFLDSNADWNHLHKVMTSTDFIDQVIDVLAKSKIDLGLRSMPETNVLRRLRNALRGRHVPGALQSRFEFSMMRAGGGHILPHTDSPQKHITLVVSMVQPGEWDQAWGGGTDLMRPVDLSDNFNFRNRYLRFDEVETIDTMAYEPNQCVIFIKTFNSLHAVKPMTGPHDVLRRTLTVNIESI
ncbi:hypothetical protein ACO2Q9_13105 [Variovorax sp. VNK109]|uniref:hypothetical protein n=1 Tax=Variovorax sp. VNK109 TaxID=3400919 RepID=UPI003C1151B7